MVRTCRGVFRLVLPALLLFPDLPVRAQEVDSSVDRAVARVDSLFAETWKREGITPSARSDDAEFLRRVSIDIAGVTPSPDEVRAFLGDRDPRKRTRKVEQLLAGPLYVRHWARYWENVLIGRDARRRFNRIYKNAFRPWVKEALAKNMPYDAFVRELLTARGKTESDGSTVFLVRWGESPADVAGQTTKIFMGIRTQCAQCHDHPFEEITQKDFWGMAAFFARTRRRPYRGENGKPAGVRLFERRRGEVFLPDSKVKVDPKFLRGEPSPLDRTTNRRDLIARLITAPANKPFGRAIVNRMWGHFFGRAFVNPIDDFNATNVPSHPGILDFLAEDFVEHGYDLKRLIRIIARSRVYQLSSKPSPGNAKDEKHFSRAYVRPMSPEQLFYSLLQATQFEGIFNRRARNNRAAQFLDQALERFTFLFDNDEGNEKLDFVGTITQALFLMNGRMTNDTLSVRRGVLMKILEKRRSAADRLEEIFLLTVSRPPTSAERRLYLSFLRDHGNRIETYEDIFWVLLNSSEFFFNH